MKFNCKEDIIQITPLWKGERMEDGRPKVSADVLRRLRNITLEEAWGCGTAAVVSPIGRLAYKDKVFVINEGKIGEVTQMLYDTLTGIQWGKIADPFGWTQKVD